MRDKMPKKKKSHNIGKTGRHKNSVRRKCMTPEERSAQVDRQITLIILLVILVIIVVIAVIVVRKSMMKEKEHDEQSGKCENGEYIGEREVEIRELINMEVKKEKLPEFSLYDNTKEMDIQNRFDFYKGEVKSIVYPENMRSSNILKDLTTDELAQWSSLNKDIERMESKKGNSENVAELEGLCADEYRGISEGCYQLYCICSQGNMATRYGRNAGDALKIGLEKKDDYTQLIADWNRSDEGYVTSFHYRDCEQKRADGCYWLGNNYYQFLYHYSGLTEQEKEHCALMAYFYSFYGFEISGEEGVQHRNDLKEMKEETERILIEEYNYPVYLFGEA